MKALKELSPEQLGARIEELQKSYDEMKAMNLKLDMSRGKPGADQLALANAMLHTVTEETGFKAEDGTDVRNYGILDGIAEAKALFSPMLGAPASQIIVGGNSSLNMMFDFLTMAMLQGLYGNTPWSKLEKVTFLCPSPGYDRHFAITEFLGIHMVPVSMTKDGPDMDEVEQLVKDPAVKGMWCVPKYSNPDGYTYSDETVKRLASMQCATPDFTILWDNAYCVHHLNDTPDALLNILEQTKKAGNDDRAAMFVSTSKLSFPGAGVAAMAGGERLIGQVKKRMSFQTIGYDKINMLRHTRFFKDMDGIEKHMKKHAAILAPKFNLVLDNLEASLGGKGIATWNKPNGGYFISVNLHEGCARETIAMVKDAGVVMTPAGATYPYGKDPKDANIRIAPTMPPLSELQTAIKLFCLCAELVYAKKLLSAN